MNKVLMYAGGAVLAVILLGFVCRILAKKKHVVYSGMSGVAVLILLNLTSGITGVGVGYSLLSVASAALLGLPGVALLLLGRFL